MSLKPGERPRNTRGTGYKILAVRPLTEADLPALREKSAPWARLKSLRDSHHQVARLMALGLNNIQVADAAGVSVVTVSRYRRDPAMQDLVDNYRGTIDSAYEETVRDIASSWASAARKSLRTIHDHYDEAEERGELVQFAKAFNFLSDFGDRFGYGKKSASLNVNVNYAAELEAAIQRTKRIAAE